MFLSVNNAVDLYSGTNSVSLKIDELTSGGVTVPIMLSYSGRGNKLNETPSWVGLGWNLVAGGAISRKVNSRVDELKDVKVMIQPDSYWPYTVKTYYTPTSHDESYFTSANRTFLNGSTWYSASVKSSIESASKMYELDPDEFSFSFLGFSGTLMMDDAGAWQIITSNTNVKVCCKGSCQAKYLLYRFNLFVQRHSPHSAGGW